MPSKSLLAVTSLLFLNGCFLLNLMPQSDSVLDSGISFETAQVVDGLPKSFRTARADQNYLQVVATSPEDFLTDIAPSFYSSVSNCPFNKEDDFVAFGPFLPDGREMHEAVDLARTEGQSARDPDADGLYRYHVYLLIEDPEWQQRFGESDAVCLAIIRPGMPRALFSNYIRIDLSHAGASSLMGQ